MSIWRSPIAKAKERGRDDFQRGIPQDGNPYKGAKTKQAWFNAWLAAKSDFSIWQNQRGKNETR